MCSYSKIQTCVILFKKMSGHVNCVAIKPENSEIDRKLYAIFINSIRLGYVEVGDEKICMPASYEKIADEIENFQVKDSDVFICTFPKAGTTWMQEMVWMILNNLDKEAGQQFILARSPFIEYSGLIDYRNIDFKKSGINPPEYIKESVNYTKNVNDPRIIKTHLPWSLMPKQIRDKSKKPKIIYVYRNPKDVIVSFYHHSRLLDGYFGDLETFLDLFLGNRLMYTPFWTNIFGFWHRRNEPNILFVRYEDMKQDLTKVVQLVAQFLGRELHGDQVAQLVDHLSFERMKDNKSCNYADVIEENKKFWNNEEVTGTFMRSGTVGSYKAELSPEMIRRIDEWTEDSIKGTGFQLS